MRNSRDRWTFFRHDSKPALSASEVTYWKNAFKRILKVGQEFEFNLPDSKGSCKGNSQVCACEKMMSGANCWKECRHYNICKNEAANKPHCKNYSEECANKNCEKCDKFQFHCSSVYCPDFEAKCVICPDFVRPCKNCVDAYDPKHNPKGIREQVSGELGPSECYGIVSSYGVHSITRDGSLLGDKGMEIITVGRRVDYWEFYRMAKRIIDAAVSKGAYVNERCSAHMHLLATYYGKIHDPERAHNEVNLPGIPTNISELERNVPQIVAANFHQLCRRYQNAITWMTMTLDEPERMTRWEKFRVSVLDVSAVLNSMKEVVNVIGTRSGKNKYGWVNYSHCLFAKNGDLSRFHVEMRSPDGILCPSAVAALGCMFYALAIKAVEISKYGVLEVGDDEWLRRAKEIKGAILNGMGDYKGSRFGDTSRLPSYYETLKAESYDLCRQLKHILVRSGPAYHVLEKLAERPIALRRCDGERWEEIEGDLEVPMGEETAFEAKISEFVDLRLVDECQSLQEWVAAVTTALQEDPEINDPGNLEEKIGSFVEDKRNEGEMVWSDTLGALVAV